LAYKIYVRNSLQYPDKEVDKDIPTMMQPKRFIKNKQSVIKEILENNLKKVWLRIK